MRTAKQVHYVWAPSTLRQYNNTCQNFAKFCVENKLSWPPRSTAVIADYLCSLADRSDRPQSMLKCARSALVALYSGMDIGYIAQDPTLIMLCTSLVKAGTSTAMKRSHVMPVEAFTDLFRNWTDNENLSIKDLRLKTICLFAIAAMLRPSDIAPKSVYYDPATNTEKRITFNANQIDFTPEGDATIVFLGTKNDSTRSGFQVTLRKASDTRIDPVCALHTYIDRTEKQRGDPNGPVFLSLTKPYNALTADSIGSVLQDGIKRAGLQGFSAKDFRPTGATMAADAAITQQDADKVVKLGRWKEKSTFLDHYWHSKPGSHTTDTMLGD